MVGYKTGCKCPRRGKTQDMAEALNLGPTASSKQEVKDNIVFYCGTILMKCNKL
jgi:hypothetical protein